MGLHAIVALLYSISLLDSKTLINFYLWRTRALFMEYFHCFGSSQSEFGVLWLKKWGSVVLHNGSKAPLKLM